MTGPIPRLDHAALPPGSLIIHASESWVAAMERGDFDFFQKLGDRAGAESVVAGFVDADTDLSQSLLGQDHKHVFLGNRGPARQRALFAMPGYIWGFWYLDPAGIHWNASLAEATFQPDQIDPAEATYFFNGVSGYMLRENVSKFEQAHRAAPLPSARAVVFLQEIETYRTRVHHLTSDQMIRLTARATTERVYVKLHPAQSGPSRERMQRFCRQFPNVELSDRSVHDLTAASDLVITQNSAAGFEALMQKKPVITCAQTDYHHATIPVTSGRELEAALADAPERQADFPFEAYFYWFLGLNLLEPQKDEFADRAWARIERHFS